MTNQTSDNPTTIQTPDQRVRFAIPKPPFAVKPPAAVKIESTPVSDSSKPLPRFNGMTDDGMASFTVSRDW